MLNLLLAMRLGANSASGTEGSALGARRGIETASNEQSELGDTTTAGKAKREWQSGFQMVRGRGAEAGLAIYL